MINQDNTIDQREGLNRCKEMWWPGEVSMRRCPLSLDKSNVK